MIDGAEVEELTEELERVFYGIRGDAILHAILIIIERGMDHGCFCPCCVGKMARALLARPDMDHHVENKRVALQ
jgi:hypothetical protein